MEQYATFSASIVSSHCDEKLLYNVTRLELINIRMRKRMRIYTNLFAAQ